MAVALEGKLRLDTRPFSTALKAAANQTQVFSEKAGKLLSAFGKGAGIGAAIFVASRALQAAGKQSKELGDSFGRIGDHANVALKAIGDLAAPLAKLVEPAAEFAANMLAGAAALMTGESKIREFGPLSEAERQAELQSPKGEKRRAERAEAARKAGLEAYKLREAAQERERDNAKALNDLKETNRERMAGLQASLAELEPLEEQIRIAAEQLEALGGIRAAEEAINEAAAKGIDLSEKEMQRLESAVELHKKIMGLAEEIVKKQNEGNQKAADDLEKDKDNLKKMREEADRIRLEEKKMWDESNLKKAQDVIDDFNAAVSKRLMSPSERRDEAREARALFRAQRSEGKRRARRAIADMDKEGDRLHPEFEGLDRRDRVEEWKNLNRAKDDLRENRSKKKGDDAMKESKDINPVVNAVRDGNTILGNIEATLDALPRF